TATKPCQNLLIHSCQPRRTARSTLRISTILTERPRTIRSRLNPERISRCLQNARHHARNHDPHRPRDRLFESLPYMRLDQDRSFLNKPLGTRRLIIIQRTPQTSFNISDISQHLALPTSTKLS